MYYISGVIFMRTMRTYRALNRKKLLFASLIENRAWQLWNTLAVNLVRYNLGYLLSAVRLGYIQILNSSISNYKIFGYPDIIKTRSPP